jgi:hypothetical protein
VSAIAARPPWRTFLFDSIGLVVVVWSIPVAILLIGAPIAFVVNLVIALGRWMLQP